MVYRETDVSPIGSAEVVNNIHNNETVQTTFRKEFHWWV